MPKVISVVNLKGGVGKTAIAVNFAAFCGREGYRTLFDELFDLLRVQQKELQPKEIKIGLSHLVALSRVDKGQWKALIEEYSFPITIRPRDASRDILGKLLKYLEQNAEAREKLSQSTASSPRKASPELLKALASLMKD
jgi:anion-transporting  ArsA/GET3 family ATPase